MSDVSGSVSPNWLIENLRAAVPLRVLDARKRPAFEESGEMIEGAIWHDPSNIDDWASQYARNEPLVVYCVHGHEVSQNTVTRLVQMGYDARFLQGGFVAWLEAGGVAIKREAGSGGNVRQWIKLICNRTRPVLISRACKRPSGRGGRSGYCRLVGQRRRSL